MHQHGLLVKISVELTGHQRHGWLHHCYMTANLQYPGRLRQKLDRTFQVVQHIEHNDAAKNLIWKWKPVSIRDHIDAWKRQDVGGYDIGPDFLDVSRSTSDVEDRTFDATLQQSPMEVLVQKTYRLLLRPDITMSDLTRVEIGQTALFH